MGLYFIQGISKLRLALTPPLAIYFLNPTFISNLLSLQHFASQ